jgi:hypothetical protein
MWIYQFPDDQPLPPASIECRKVGHDWDDPAADAATCNACGMTRHRDTEKKD